MGEKKRSKGLEKIMLLIVMFYIILLFVLVVIFFEIMAFIKDVLRVWKNKI